MKFRAKLLCLCDLNYFIDYFLVAGCSSLVKLFAYKRSDRELIGQNNQYLPKIIVIFAEILCAGNDLATEQTVSRMINLLRQLQQTLPPSTLASTWSSLHPQQQLALQSILSS
ncbi:importin-5-like [Trifolium medium]|uniref:Importin-5-like n=1 Tax=Trifolium medium TaxID=97028 RepID=A0A392P8T9_9FABA|nr:importin-5-like [Trifolium medium]